MRFIKYWLPVLLWMGFIFWMSSGTFSSQNTSLIIEPLISLLLPSLSQEEIDMIHGVIRKAGHVAEYFIFGTLLFRAFRNSLDKQRVWQWALYSLLITTGYAAGDEFHQSFVSTRTASLADVCIDISGGLLALAGSVLCQRRTRQNSK
ncbi:MAG: VanZ family protein [Thermodesulfovibrionales bacterium]